MMALMSISRGVSAITETIFENRMMHAGELRRMGADVRVIGNTAIVKGGKALSGGKGNGHGPEGIGFPYYRRPRGLWVHGDFEDLPHRQGIRIHRREAFRPRSQDNKEER